MYQDLGSGKKASAKAQNNQAMQQKGLFQKTHLKSESAIIKAAFVQSVMKQDEHQDGGSIDINLVKKFGKPS